MQSTIVYLIGFAGTGKHTIALEICRLTGARLVDNHLINNPVFSLIQADGKTRLPETVWKKTWAIRHIVLDVYPVHPRSRKSLGEIIRKLSVTESQNSAHLLGTWSRRNSRVVSANSPQVP